MMKKIIKTEEELKNLTIFDVLHDVFGITMPTREECSGFSAAADKISSEMFLLDSKRFTLLYDISNFVTYIELYGLVNLHVIADQDKEIII